MKYPLAKPHLTPKDRAYLLDAFDSNWISSGKYVSKFQDSFAHFCESKYGIATNSGTSALHLALVALGAKENCEVIIPDLTFIAVANAVTYTGAKPIFADVKKDTWQLDPDKIKPTERTKGIIAVHSYGSPCELDRIKEICNRHSLFLIEDCAEAHGATYKGRKVGSFGDVSCFSFYGNKILTTGEGGMCVTNDLGLSETIAQLRDHGEDSKENFRHPVIGYSYGMTNLQAAIGCSQLERIDKTIERYKWIGKQYSLRLKNRHPDKQGDCVYWIYSVPKETDRGALMRKGIETRELFPPISTQPPYLQTPNPIALSIKGTSLPTYQELSEDDIDYISGEVNKSWI